jgi:hypothetical protein
MKKIAILAVCLMLASISVVTAATLPRTHNQPILDPTGSFAGSIGYKRQGGNWTSVGDINGSYELRNKGGRFTGDWSINLQNNSASGTIRGVFRTPYFFGRVLVDGGRRAPIVGFLFARNNTFAGRFMAPVGPALYFKGTFT